MGENIITSSIKFIIKDLIGDFLYWPIWWYSRGLVTASKFSWHSITEQEHALGVSIWIKNILTPMYGQTDWEGRVISLVMRVIQIIIRSVALALWMVAAVIPLIAWITLPVVIILQIYLNITDLWH